MFHAGDGNLHPLILYDANIPGQLAAAEALGGEILAKCVAVGGTVTGEHGVGVEKLDAMCGQFSSPELAQMHRLKEAFDPDGLFNPGKGVPTLMRCTELGGMHVHGGACAFRSAEILMEDRDRTEAVLDAVAATRDTGGQLRIRGRDSKHTLARVARVCIGHAPRSCNTCRCGRLRA